LEDTALFVTVFPSIIHSNRGFALDQNLRIFWHFGRGDRFGNAIPAWLREMKSAPPRLAPSLFRPKNQLLHGGPMRPIFGYLQWCQERGVEALPAQPATVMAIGECPLQAASLAPRMIAQSVRERTAAARVASIAGRQRGSDRAGSRHLAAGSRLRLRACRCRSRLQSRCSASAEALTLMERRRETVALATDGRAMVTVSVISVIPVRRGRTAHFRLSGIAYMAGLAAASTRSRMTVQRG